MEGAIWQDGFIWSMDLEASVGEKTGHIHCFSYTLSHFKSHALITGAGQICHLFLCALDYSCISIIT